MEMRSGQALHVAEPSGTGEARRQVTRIAQSLGFDETDVGRAALVATELSGNLAKHAAGGGELLLHTRVDGNEPTIELIALDRGPGISNLTDALRDGFSTAGTPGTGLGAAARVANHFDIHSAPGMGTAVLVQLWARSRLASEQRNGTDYGVVRLPKSGQEVCGDSCSAFSSPESLRVMMADGLGHGSGAAEASTEAARIFDTTRDRPLAEVIDRMHAGLRSTRGAAVAVAEVDMTARTLSFVGIGNITGTIVAPGHTQSLVSHNGTVGHQLGRVKEFSYPWPAGALLILHSDGLSSRWNLESYDRLGSRHPSLIAGVLYRDFSRGRDDSTVAVFREARPETR